MRPYRMKSTQFLVTRIPGYVTGSCEETAMGRSTNDETLDLQRDDNDQQTTRGSRRRLELQLYGDQSNVDQGWESRCRPGSLPMIAVGQVDGETSPTRVLMQF